MPKLAILPIFATWGQKSLSCAPTVVKFDILLKELNRGVYFDLS